MAEKSGQNQHTQKKKEWPLNHESVTDSQGEYPVEWVEETAIERKREG